MWGPMCAVAHWFEQCFSGSKAAYSSWILYCLSLQYLALVMPASRAFPPELGSFAYALAGICLLISPSPTLIRTSGCLATPTVDGRYSWSGRPACLADSSQSLRLIRSLDKYFQVLLWTKADCRKRNERLLTHRALWHSKTDFYLVLLNELLAFCLEFCAFCLVRAYFLASYLVVQELQQLFLTSGVEEV